MKIITITFFRTFNYGAALQAYALQKKLNNLNYETKILNFRPPLSEKRFIKVFQSPKSIKEFILNIITLSKYKESIRKINNANKFLNNYLNLTQKYETYDEVMNHLPIADIYFCGSDQIWNPKIFNRLHPLYFLDFVDSRRSIKASFSASIAENYIEKKYTEEIKNYLSTFDFISVREEKAKELLEFTGREIEIIADPVFLLNKQEWLSIAKLPLIKEKYILCYFLYQPKFLNNLLKKLKKETGYKIISVTPEPFSKIYHDKLIMDVGPDGFLGLIANAEMVITSSFHGTALSILLEKQFYSIIGKTRGSRITNVLNKLNLSGRVITDKENELNLSNEIDYNVTTSMVNKLRSESLAYIQKVIDFAKNKRIS